MEIFTEMLAFKIFNGPDEVNRWCPARIIVQAAMALEQASK
jgi:hypothetical protein